MNAFYLIDHLVFSTILFFVGIWGILSARKNMILTIVSVELMFLAVNINFVLFSIYLNDIVGQIFALLVLTVAAAESAIGLALLVIYYKIKHNIDAEYLNVLKG